MTPTTTDSIDETPPEPEGWGWTRRQRITLAVLLGILLVALTIQYIRRPYRLDDTVVIVHGAPVSLPAGIDPNTADAASLSRIPNVGAKTAQAIIDYRIAHQDAPGGIVFRTIDDLRKVPKLRRQTVDYLRAFLVFPEDTPTSPRGLIPPTTLPD